MKTFLYSDLINENYDYSLNNDIITIYKNCNNGTCDCESVFIKNDYIRSDIYTCSKQNVIPLDHNIFTSSEFYRLDYWNILFIFLVMCFIIIYCPLKIILRFFRRFDF